MSDICIYMATEKYDPISAFIREKTNCSWSHVGFYRQSDKMTFSAMCDGKGVAWRPVKPNQEILLLTAPSVDEAFQKALTQEGRGYDLLDIAGMELGKNLTDANHWICDVLVFWSFEQAGNALLNTTFIPRCHLTPRDILLSPRISLLQV